MKNKTSEKKQRRDSGQAIVEFAIVVPLLLTLLLGIMEWGFLIWTQNSFVNAVRDGAREAVVMQEWNSARTIRENDVRNIVMSRLDTLPDSLKSGINGRISIELLPDSYNVRSIRVSIVNQPYHPIIGFASIIVPATLSASAEFRYESAM